MSEAFEAFGQALAVFMDEFAGKKPCPYIKICKTYDKKADYCNRLGGKMYADSTNGHCGEYKYFAERGEVVG